MDLDLLLLHVPRLRASYLPFGEFSFINLMPMGLFSLADMARRKGYKARILHYQVEKIANPCFSLGRFILRHRPKVIGLPLSWHPQSYDVIEVAGKIKKDFPEIFIVLGGFTASAYPVEIMQNHSQVDAIIRGEGEVPLANLLDSLGSGRTDLGHVPNLAWRDGDKVVMNPLSWQAGRDDLSSYRFSDLRLLFNYRIYRSSIGLPPLWLKGATRGEMRNKIRRFTGIFCLSVGRGCSVDCTWCGGGKTAQKMLAGRKRPVFTSPESAVETVEEAISFGYPTIYISFDPYPGKPEFYLEFFRLLRKKGLRPDAYFECWSVPIPEFIEEFAATFKPGSLLGISPESGSEKVRRINKGMPYSNFDLLKTLDMIAKQGIFADLTFSLGIPGEGPAEIEETKNLIRRIESHPAIDQVMTMFITMEPFSPWQIEPERFGIVHGNRSFEDFRKAAGNPAKDPFSYLGYTYDGKPYDEFTRYIQDIRCSEFCPLPWMAPGLTCPRMGKTGGKDKKA
ncbi:MAG: radical SAM protein [Candidatus Eremiobacteraeota bacterium]|nr:radical SAM protein [Candidatus Eremiobacteraeota bacterium]